MWVKAKKTQLVKLGPEALEETKLGATAMSKAAVAVRSRQPIRHFLFDYPSKFLSLVPQGFPVRTTQKHFRDML